MKKRSILLSVFAILTLLFCILPTSAASASGSDTRSIPIYLEGERLWGVGALLIDSTTYVPLRKMSDAAGDCEISWNEKTRTATVIYDGITINAKAGDQYISANGRYFYTVGKVLNINGSIYVPVRALARALKLEVAWDANTRSVHLTHSDSELIAGSGFYSTDEIYWLSRIIHAEAGGECFDGKVAVGNVVLNRVASKQYPNTIYGVIFDFRHGIQFTPAYTGTIYNSPSAESVIAAKVCLEGYETVDGALFFFNPRIATSNWISQNRPFAKTIGNHNFYY